MKIIEIRERYPEKTLGELYNPQKMPFDLKKVHQGIDLAVDQLYSTKIFSSDDERLNYLLEHYKKITQNPSTKGSGYKYSA